MKILIFVFCFLSNFCFATFNHTSQKYYLGIFVGKYQNADWSALSSGNDKVIVLDMLKSQGFNDQASITLEDEAAIKSNILSAIEKLCAVLEEGDIVYFHFSGHGQQVKDFKKGVIASNGILKSDEWDGKDEALVLYNGVQNWENDYDLNGHFVDDEISVMLNKFRNKVGKSGQVLAVFDCCHSGTASRGGDDCRVRGVSAVCSPDDQFESNGNSDQESEVDLEMKGNLAPVFCFFGCSSIEKNQEYKNYGSLSLFLVQSIAELRDHASYQNLYSSIREKMAVNLNASQSPSVEGDQLDQLIFSGNVLIQEKFFCVHKCSGYKATLDAGEIESIQVGDSIGFFSNEVLEFEKAKPMIVGWVESVSPVSCEVRSQKIFKNAKMYRAVVIKKVLPPIRIKVQMDIKDKKIRKKVQARLQEAPFIQWVEGDQRKYRITLDEGSSVVNALMIYCYQGEREYPLRDMKSLSVEDEKTVDMLYQYLLMASRADLFTQMAFDDPNIQKEITIEPTKVTRFQNGRIITSSGSSDTFRIKVSNTGNSPFFMNVIDISPNGVYGGLKDKENVLILPDNIETIDVTGISDPKGTEGLKILCSDRPLELQNIMAMGRTITRGGDDDIFLRLFENGVSGTRSCSSAKIGIDTYDYYFEIE